MEPLTLVVMAAGIGSRFGGLKQIEPAGPHGETLLDYSVFDALRAGFGRIVFVIRRDIEAAFRETVLPRFEGRADVSLAFQELDQIPPGFTVPAGRAKPWGTGHAALTAASSVTTPFALINADDFYGAEPFARLAEHFREAAGEDDVQALVAYRLSDTLSDHGGVARGVCRVRDGWLEDIEELSEVARHEDGLRGRGREGVRGLSGDEPASMNLWGFRPGIVALLRERFEVFLSGRGADPKAEFMVPVAVNELMRAGRVRVRVLSTRSPWFGVTHRDDLPRVRAAIASLVASGAYSAPLWGA